MSRHAPPPSSSRIYIGNLPDDVNQRQLDDIFEKYGRVRDIDIKYGRTTNNTAYAFVEFADSRDAEDAVAVCNGMKFADTELRVEFTGGRRPRIAMGKPSGPPKRSDYRVQVTGLPPSASWQDLKDHMRQAGHVGYANIERGRGVVEYESYDDMRWAVKELDGSEFRNIFGKCPITVRASRSNDRSCSRSRSRSRSKGKNRRRSRSTSESRSRSRGDRRRRASTSRSSGNRERGCAKGGGERRRRDDNNTSKAEGFEVCDEKPRVSRRSEDREEVRERSRSKPKPAERIIPEHQSDEEETKTKETE
eukprot:GHVS01073149.1.p1 GENE.GHVS01073149.1~~GHVS01073149.1.p1  ORF type:complete len:306 (-),score=42.87 GHVS01073149.1:282-1199(-)